MANSADPDQLASSEANWSGSILFAKAWYIRVQQDKGFLVEKAPYAELCKMADHVCAISLIQLLVMFHFVLFSGMCLMPLNPFAFVFVLYHIYNTWACIA